MKKLLLKKSRKLILLLLLGFRYYIIMKVSFVSMLNISNSADGSTTNNNNNTNCSNIDTNNTNININYISCNSSNSSSSSSSSSSDSNSSSNSSNSIGDRNASINSTNNNNDNNNVPVIIASAIPDSAILTESIMSLSLPDNINMMTMTTIKSIDKSESIRILNETKILSSSADNNNFSYPIKLKNLTNHESFTQTQPSLQFTTPTTHTIIINRQSQQQNDTIDTSTRNFLNHYLNNNKNTDNKSKIILFNNNMMLNIKKRNHYVDRKKLMKNFKKFKNYCKNLINCLQNKIKNKRNVNNDTNKDNDDIHDDDDDNLENIKNSEYEEQKAIVIAMKHEQNNYNKNRNLNKNENLAIQSEAGSILFVDNDGNGNLINKNDLSNNEIDENNKNIDYYHYSGIVTTTSNGLHDSNYENNESYDDDTSSSYDYEPQQYDYNDIPNDDNDREVKSSNSYFVTAKNLWDIFMAVNSAWNNLGKFEENQQQQQQKEQEQHINENEIYENQTHRNDNDEINKEERLRRDSFYSEIDKIPKYDWIDNDGNNHEPSKSLSSTIVDTMKIKNSVAEGRYIKADPLKGYYDFVITEGSYKFWACFQLATAILIIYSTFAAIYYSKVNPLVGDYDYVDYLGGARSLSESSDQAFIDIPSYSGSENGRKSNDDNNDGSNSIMSSLLSGKTMTKTIWSSFVNGDWIPRTEYTIKFILDAIDKIPSSS